jgi:alpha-glucuronidase
MLLRAVGVLVGIYCTAAAAAAAVTVAAGDPATWLASPGHFCHAATPSARVLNIETATHKQCAEACAKIGCGCFDMSDNGKGTKASGACRGTMTSILHPSGDRTAYTNSSAPRPAPPAPPAPAPGPARPSTWSQLWLDYRPINTGRSLRGRSATFTQLYCGNTSAGGILGNACAELLLGLGGMLGERPTLVSKITADDVLVLDAGNLTTAWPPDTAAETFQIGSGRAAPQCMGHSCTLISGPSEVSVLYGVFRFLSAVRRDSPSTTGDAQPANPLRVWDLWDNVDGSVERGYAGRSIFDWSQLPKLLPRYRDYARLLASIGINAIVWNNVNACGNDNQHILEHEYAQSPVWTNLCSALIYYVRNRYLLKLAPLAELFYSYGIVSLITPCFTAPQTIGGLSTSDPLDKLVVSFWKDKVAEIVAVIPSFRGFLAKADSEGQPGPMKYNRTEADGANLFGSVLDPLPHIGAPGVAIWRSFSHPNYNAPPPMNDQAFFQCVNLLARFSVPHRH